MTAVQSKVVIRPRFIRVGPDQLVLAKLIQVLLEQRGILVEFRLVIHGLSASDILEQFGIDFKLEGVKRRDLQTILGELNVQEILDRPEFKDLRAGSMSNPRTVLDGHFAAAAFHAHCARSERKARGYFGPNTDSFNEAAETLTVWIEHAVRGRLQQKPVERAA